MQSACQLFVFDESMDWPRLPRRGAAERCGPPAPAHRISAQANSGAPVHALASMRWFALRDMSDRDCASGIDPVGKGTNDVPQVKKWSRMISIDKQRSRHRRRFDSRLKSCVLQHYY